MMKSPNGTEPQNAPLNTEILKTDRATVVKVNGVGVASLPFRENCADSFQWNADKNVWIITRTSAAPCTDMTIDLQSAGAPSFWLVPGVNYQGNGWGSGAQYTGFRYDGSPWVYAWHRVAIPACTYVEQNGFSIALWGTEDGSNSCSIYEEDGVIHQQIIWPETEAPKSLSKRFWKPAIRKEMPPAVQFKAVLYIAQISEAWEARKKFTDTAWLFFRRDLTMPRSPEALRRLDIAFFKQCFLKLADGVTGFVRGMHWSDAECCFIKHRGDFEAGWCGQNISIACALLQNYVYTKDQDSLRKGLAVLDSWIQYGRLGNGLVYSTLVCNPKVLSSRPNGEIPTVVDACNLGVTATYLFKAAALAETLEIERPAYAATAFEICDLILGIQRSNGELARSWFLDGSVDARHGTVGCYLIPPLFDAWNRRRDERYKNAALKAFEFYYNEFIKSGVTTAGALDSNCIDKESAGPLLRSALACYKATDDRNYLSAAVRISTYLDTWQWHYSIRWPQASELAQASYDSFGGTSVSAAHNALDQFALYYVSDLIELGALTNDPVLLDRARAIWFNSTQLISDGTLCINGHVRPAGGQDESIRHTYWGRPDLRHFVFSEWLTVWMGAYRYWAMENTDVLNFLQ